MRSLLETGDYKPQFAGHETFALRYGWLKKAFDAVSSYKSKEKPDPNSIFNDDASIADFGVGKNMVQSIRHWSLAAGILRLGETESGSHRLEVSNLGRLIFEEEGDPFLEHPGTLWLAHWHLASNPNRTTTWYWAFNELNESSFDRDLLVQRLWARIESLRENGRMKETRLSQTTVRRDVECFVRTYLAKSQSAKGLHEENLESPLAELSLVNPMGVGGGFQFRRGPKPTLPDEVFLYGLVGFWQALYPKRREFSVEALSHEPGSPGRVFLMDEESVAERLANLADLTRNRIRWDENTGLRQVSAQDIMSIDPLEPVRSLYAAASIPRAA